MKPSSIVALTALAAVLGLPSGVWAQFAQPLPQPGPPGGFPVGTNPFGSGGQQINARDAQGFNWDINTQGTIIDGTDDCFDGGMVMTVNGSEFSSVQQAVDPKTKEMVLTATLNNVEVSRRIFVDAQNAYVRYVEVFTNTSRQRITVPVQIATELGVNSQVVITDTGNQNGALGPKDRGLVAMQQPGGSRPSMMMAIADPNGKTRPQLAIDGTMIFRENYNLEIPARKSVAILHAIGQRRLNGVPDPKQLATMFKPFTARDLTRGLPPAIRRSIINWRVTTSGENGLRLAAVASLAEYLDVERGKQDVLYFDENARLIGQAEGESVEVTTVHGAVTVPWEEVALLAGGADVDRTPRVYLRNGEILTGGVVCAGLKFHTENGVETAPSPDKINYLFTAVDDEDGKPAKGTLAYALTRRGDRLALLGGGAAVADDGGDASGDEGSAAEGSPPSASPPELAVLTPWGPLRVPLAEMAGLVYIRDPQPGHVLILKDNTRLAVMPSGVALEADTPRLGRLALSPREIARIEAVGVAAVELQYAAEGFENAELAAAHCVLSGGNLLVGNLASKQLAVVTGGGVSSLDVEKIDSIELLDDEGLGASPTYTIALKGGGSLSGQLQDGAITLQAATRQWRIPARQLVVYQSERPEEESDEGGAEVAEGGDPAELLKQAETAAQNGQFARARQLVEQAAKMQDDADEATREKIKVYLQALQQIEGAPQGGTAPEDPEEFVPDLPPNPSPFSP